MIEINIQQFARICEAHRYPGLLALIYGSEPSTKLTPEVVFDAILEPSLDASVNADDRFRELVELGELGAARVMGPHTGIPDEQRKSLIFRQQAKYKQDIEAQIRRVHGLLLIVGDSAPARRGAIGAKLDALLRDPAERESRPGKLVRALKELEQQLEEEVRGGIEVIRTEMCELRAATRPLNERDLTLALNRLDALLTSEESLPNAQRLLMLARRARDSQLNADDLRTLHHQGLHEARFIRPWSAVAPLPIATPSDVLHLIDGSASLFVFSSESDRRKVQELFHALVPNPVSTELVARRLLSVLGQQTEGVQVLKGSIGSTLRLQIASPRVPALRDGQQPFPGGIQLVLPLRPDEAILPRLVTEAPSGSLRIVVYPGRLDRWVSPPLPNGAAVAIDLVDLMRLVECPPEKRMHGLQQIILPRLPLTLVKPYQGGGAVAPEMFRGRQLQIEKLKKARGATVLFSGRMMGKSSILKRLETDIESRRAAGDTREIAIRISNAGDDLLPRLIERLSALDHGRGRRFAVEEERIRNRSTRTKAERRGATRERLGNLRRLLTEVLENGTRLSILIDEADLFAAADADRPRDESLAWLLRDLEQERPEQLRLVFAGFQTIHHQVLSNNGAFANWYGLEPVGPLEESDAEALVSEPFADFGFLFASAAGIRRILEFTGRHPLLIQEACTRLMDRIDARRRKTAEDEVILVQAGDVETVCRDDHLRDRVRQVLSLNLEQYPRLKLVVYLILYASALASPGSRIVLEAFNLNDLKRVLFDFYGDRFNDYFDERSIGVLVRELEVLGLLARHGDKYEFVNRTFATMLSEDRRFDSELERLLEQVTNPNQAESRRLWTLPEEHVPRLVRPGEGHVLVVGLPRTLRSFVATQLFGSNDLGTQTEGDVLVVSAADCSSLPQLENKLHLDLKERRAGVGTMLAKRKASRLVLDDADDLARGNALLPLINELGKRQIQLIAFGGPILARHYVTRLGLEENLDVVTLRRLRAQDIRAWGERGAGRSLDEFVIFDDASSSQLAEHTGGYFPMILRFWEFLRTRQKNTKEFIPEPELIRKFSKQIDSRMIEETLLSRLDGGERMLLGRLYKFAADTGEWEVDWEFVDDELNALAKESGIEKYTLLDCLQTLELLDLLEFSSTRGRRHLVLRASGPLYSFFVKKP